MSEITMDEGREKNPKDMIGIPRGYSKPGERYPGEPFGQFNDPEYRNEKRGDCNSIADPVPDDLKIQNISFY